MNLLFNCFLIFLSIFNSVKSDEQEVNTPTQQTESVIKPEESATEITTESDDDYSDYEEPPFSFSVLKGRTKHLPKGRLRKQKKILKPKGRLRKYGRNATTFKYVVRTAPNGQEYNFKISSWNLDGLQTWYNRKGFQYIHEDNPDILCLQETKSVNHLVLRKLNITEYSTFWVRGIKSRKSGIGLYTKQNPLNLTISLGVKELDNEGRLMTVEFEKFFLVNVFLPNAGYLQQLLPKRLQWDKELRTYLKKLDEIKPVILAGDLNVAHLSIDVHDPYAKFMYSGFTEEERNSLNETLDLGFVDTYRYLHPNKTGVYTFFTTRSKIRRNINQGMRLDYFILSKRFLPHLVDNVVNSLVKGSDHCPITLYLRL